MHEFEEVNLLKTKFHKLNVCQLIDYIVQAAQIDQKVIVSNVNVKAMNLAYELDWYRDFINNSDLVFCDGFGVLLGAKLLGYDVESTHRMTCPDYIENLGLACEQHNVSLFLLAGKPGVVEKAIAQMSAVAPKLQVQGHHGYFEKSGDENERVIHTINAFNPGVLYVGFGMPLQEHWILHNIERINARVFLPLGACLDFYTGTVYRGPEWMTDRGLEWLTRLATEPNRLWERYIIGNPLFFYRVFRERLSKNK
ncbi:WecB/TagA/CpsF family glycosyltransferase [Gloeocapsopsis crepidinum LEGE 06123]|uniref:WecB/TagA/CpsF family glycosyltransferase n=1 Tax=Gloeocapsopsis crepidinum LEGE 06123 TaxID=588587 RepID=A0ABR9UR97_9CHRO|nr:WecB/TagA/CpsF family glycosyltransferase [Gloeocapsopsis crepidinum]MBE9190580.1 WecB/TagA/CpsF family glycosyltransferase [Gloeocapsopsis crepidinum LEGE 06123]